MGNGENDGDGKESVKREASGVLIGQKRIAPLRMRTPHKPLISAGLVAGLTGTLGMSIPGGKR